MRVTLMLPRSARVGCFGELPPRRAGFLVAVASGCYNVSVAKATYREATRHE